MFDFAAFFSASEQLIQPLNILLLVGGVTFGTVIGILPGLGAPVAITVSLPFTFYMTPIQAFSLLLGIYSSAIYGGSVSAVTLGIPGTPAAAAALADGFSLFKTGSSYINHSYTHWCDCGCGTGPRYHCGRPQSRWVNLYLLARHYSDCRGIDHYFLLNR